MSEKDTQILINRLDALLDAERVTLLAGDLQEIADIAQAKEELMDALNALDAKDRAEISRLQSKVERNQVLLDGALQGIRKVASRLAALRRIRRSLETYDATGRRQTIQGEVAPKVEKRA